MNTPMEAGGTPSAAQGWLEVPLVFDCNGDSLVGVLALPQLGTPQVGIVVVVGGPQYRIGSHRQFVRLARYLASQGHAVLRFDARGMGDSTGDARAFTELDDDIDAAINILLAHQPKLPRIVLWGLCDGASAALTYWRRRADARVTAMCLLNPWLRSEQGQARTQVRHYYVQRLLQRDFWRKLLLGGVGLRALSDLTQNLRRVLALTSVPSATGEATEAENFREAMAVAWRQFPGPLMLVLSGRDYTAKEFLDGAHREPAWSGTLDRPKLHRVDLPNADHTFSADGDRVACEQAVGDWLRTLSQASITSETRS